MASFETFFFIQGIDVILRAAITPLLASWESAKCITSTSMDLPPPFRQQQPSQGESSVEVQLYFVCGTYLFKC